MNLDLWDKFRSVPETAQKRITGGRLNGMTDINPMWRMKVLTDAFGPCGIGWKYVIKDKRLEPGTAGTVAAFVDVDLYIRDGVTGGLWSEPIPGTGGSMFVAEEKSGLRTNDEAYKMALTDALSVCCKALGIGADIYWGADATKYTRPVYEAPSASKDYEMSDDACLMYVFQIDGKVTDIAKIRDADEKGTWWLRAVKNNPKATDQDKYVAERLLKIMGGK
jgi:hypothetical protein